MMTVDSPSVAIKPNSGYIASDNRVDRQIQQTETSPQAGASTRQEANHVTKAVTRNFDFDADTRALIVQTIDQRTNTVIRQYPNEVQLRLKAYLAASNAKEARSGSFDRDAIAHLIVVGIV